MTITAMRDVGATLLSRHLNRRAIIPGNTATSTGLDGVPQVGAIIDRRAFKTDFLSCVVAIPFYAAFAGVTTTGTGTCLLTARMQDSLSSGGTFANFGATGNSLRLTISTGSTDFKEGILEWDVDLSAAKRYIRVTATLLHGAATTDTGGDRERSVAHPVIIFGGGDENPAST